jgi:hypothetical protein
MFLDKITPSAEKFIEQYNRKLEIAETQSPQTGPLESRVVFEQAEISEQ